MPGYGYSMSTKRRKPATRRKTVKKKLTVRQAAKLAGHSKHHSRKHVVMMKRLMLSGKTFNQAHMAAQRAVGK